MDKVQARLDVLARLEANAKGALRHEEIAEKYRQAVKDDLTEARKLDVGPAELERTIHQLYTSTTVSRWTADVAPPETVRRGRRKRPGAAPDSGRRGKSADKAEASSTPA